MYSQITTKPNVYSTTTKYANIYVSIVSPSDTSILVGLFVTGGVECYNPSYTRNYSAVSDIDRVIWMGDLNFRAVDNRVIDRLLLQATTAPTNIILANDQLQHEMKLG